MVDLEALVPKEHLLRKIEKVMDYEWLYDRLAPYYCHDNGRPGADPVVLIKMVLLQHLFGIPSLRQTYQRIRDSIRDIKEGRTGSSLGNIPMTLQMIRIAALGEKF